MSLLLLVQIVSTEAAGVDTIFGYTGREWDNDIDLQYNRARWYDPATGRWMSQDPIGFAAGDVNLYRYVGNQPISIVDPSGKDWLSEPPGIGESLIPIWGSGRQAVNDFQNGRVGWGIFNTVMAVSDVFLIKSLVYAPAKLAIKLGLDAARKGGPKAGLLAACKVVWDPGMLEMHVAKLYAENIEVMLRNMANGEGIHILWRSGKSYFHALGKKGGMDIIEQSKASVQGWLDDVIFHLPVPVLSKTTANHRRAAFNCVSAAFKAGMQGNAPIVVTLRIVYAINQGAGIGSNVPNHAVGLPLPGVPQPAGIHQPGGTPPSGARPPQDPSPSDRK